MEAETFVQTEFWANRVGDQSKELTGMIVSSIVGIAASYLTSFVSNMIGRVVTTDIATLTEGTQGIESFMSDTLTSIGAVLVLPSSIPSRGTNSHADL